MRWSWLSCCRRCAQIESNPVQIFCSRDRFPLLGKNCVNWSGGRRKGLGRMRVASQDSASYEDIADDYYAVLGLLPDAMQKQIKKAYHCCMKACHPDLSGDDPETTNFCMFINEAYMVALMLSGMGSAFVDIFRMASSRWEKRQAKVLEQAKIRMMRQKDYDKSRSYWSHIWGKPRDYETTEEEVKERAPLAAAAAWRWRVYSRRVSTNLPPSNFQKQSPTRNSKHYVRQRLCIFTLIYVNARYARFILRAMYVQNLVSCNKK